MESIGESLKKAMTTNGTSFELQEPEPLTCMFCGAKLLFRPVKHPFENRVSFYANPYTCICPKAQKAEERHREEMRQEFIRKQQEREAAEKMERIRQLFKISSLPARFSDRTFDNFERNNNNEHAFRTAYEYADHFGVYQGEGLLFSGQVGTGKTHLAAAIAIHLLNGQIPVIFGTVTTLLGRLKQTYSKESAETEREILDALTTANLLILDDIGKEKPTTWVQQMLYEVVNTRYENRKSLVVTTNCDMKDLETRMPDVGPAIVSRLLEMCQGVKLNGPDRRKMG